MKRQKRADRQPQPKLHKVIKRWLVERDMTQITLGHRVGVHGGYFSQMVQGRNRMPPDVAKKIIEVLKIPDEDAAVLAQATNGLGLPELP